MTSDAGTTRFRLPPEVLRYEIAGTKLAVVRFCWKGKRHLEDGTQCQDWAVVYPEKGKPQAYHHFLLAGFHLSRAVAVIHRHGMTHCDLSLANVFIEPADGHICLIDCDNLACGGYLPVKVAGTPGFRAPELMGDHPVDPSPRFALAVGSAFF